MKDLLLLDDLQQELRSVLKACREKKDLSLDDCLSDILTVFDEYANLTLWHFCKEGDLPPPNVMVLCTVSSVCSLGWYDKSMGWILNSMIEGDGPISVDKWTYIPVSEDEE